jgi:hypothetical protein
MLARGGSLAIILKVLMRLILGADQ